MRTCEDVGMFIPAGLSDGGLLRWEIIELPNIFSFAFFSKKESY